MSNAGWYPDPGGQSGAYRYWNGQSWSEEVTTNPRQTPAPLPASAAQRKGGRSTRWWIAGVAVLLALGLIVWLVIRAASGGTAGTLPWEAPNGSPSVNLCTAGVINSSASPKPSKPGRVSGGHLSFPELGAPWEAPTLDNRVPFGTLAMTQVALDQANFDGNGSNWVSSILVSDLVSGDGFASSRAAAEVVLKCVLGTYYADTVVTSNVLSAGDHSVQGHAGWLIETQLGFHYPGLVATGEHVLLLVVQVGADQFGLFYASVPDTSAARLPDARQAMKQLSVDN